MTTQMFRKLPARTQKLVKKRLLEAGYSEAEHVKNMIKGESVSLQTQEEAVSERQQNWDAVAAGLRASGLDEEDINESIGERPKA